MNEGPVRCRAATVGMCAAVSDGGVEGAALHPAHHVERGAGHRGVVGEGHRFGHRHGGRPQRRDHPELAAHVVGRRQQFAERGPAGDHRMSGRVVDAVGEVGVAAGELRPPQRGRESGTCSASHVGHRLDVEPRRHVPPPRPRTRPYPPRRSPNGPDSPLGGGEPTRPPVAGMHRSWRTRVVSRRRHNPPRPGLLHGDVTDSYFQSAGSGVVPFAHVHVPWGDDMLHGRLLGGLAARALEAEHGAPGWRAARLTVDLFRPAAMAWWRSRCVRFEPAGASRSATR